MQRYFISEEEFLKKQILSSDYHHIKNVLRMNINDEFVICHNELLFLCCIKGILENSIAFEIIKEINDDKESTLDITLFFGYPKGDKAEEIVKKATELGVNAIRPLLMQRSVVRLDTKQIMQKEIRLKRIAKESSEQAERSIIPDISITNLKEADFSDFDYLFFCFERNPENGLKRHLRNLEGKKIAILTGPEGGIDPNEADYLLKHGFIPVSLGKRILKAEMAPVFILSVLSYEYEL